MNLDDELRRMFGDVEDRLDVPVRQDATETIVAGARRLRRRRVAAATASGVLAVAVLAGVGIVLATQDPESAPPAITSPVPTPSTAPSRSSSAPPSSAGSVPSREQPAGTEPGDPDGGPVTGGGGDQDEDTTTEPPPSPPAVTGSLIGPDGFGSIRLGMTYEELLATGAIQPGEPPAAGCSAYEFVDAAGSGYVHVSAAGGAQAILTSASTHTVEGVSHGWTLEQVRRVYPEVTTEAITAQNPVPVQVRGNPAVVYMIAFIGGDVVTELSLQYADQPCF